MGIPDIRFINKIPVQEVARTLGLRIGSNGTSTAGASNFTRMATGPRRWARERRTTGRP
jgi:hypothetical protein